jgi:hypothetical protein
MRRLPTSRLLAGDVEITVAMTAGVRFERLASM